MRTTTDALAADQSYIDALWGRADKRTASQLINALTMLPRVPRQPIAHDDGNPITEGHYLQVDTVYVVVKSQAGRLYAKRLVSTQRGTARWEYAPGAMNHLRHSDRLTLDDAKAMGTRLGVCVICGRTLTDQDSVERGIGPVCAARI